MRYLLNSSEMKQCDSQTSEYFQVPSLCLMERAAAAAAEEIIKRRQKGEDALIVCGSGNNGGDGMAIARMLFLAGYRIYVLFVGQEDRCTAQTKRQLAILRKYQIPVCSEFHNLDFGAYTIIVDAIFGIGMNRPAEGKYRTLIEKINQTNAAVYSVDVPSGLNADNGQIMGVCVKADFTVTFAFEKIGLFLHPGNDCVGQLICRDIGISEQSFLEMQPSVYTYSLSDLKRLFPKRRRNSNKGSYGKLTLLVGSASMAGAAYFAAMAAYRTGCGLVRIVTPKENQTILQTLLPEAVLTIYDRQKPQEQVITDAMKWATVVGVGCGLGNDENAWEVLRLALKAIGERNIPYALDADALNLLAERQDYLQKLPPNAILTPHLGEMARLTGQPISQIKDNLLETAKQAALKWNACIVLKDARTFVTAPDCAAFLNLHGCNGLATGGSGDALTGIICGLLALGAPVKEAADLGVLLHALAGEKASQKEGNSSMIARDIVEGISAVLKEMKP